MRCFALSVGSNGTTAIAFRVACHASTQRDLFSSVRRCAIERANHKRTPPSHPTQKGRGTEEVPTVDYYCSKRSRVVTQHYYQI